ncbi:MAG: TadE/TadG family type IV pilus assembly protein [Actinomycetota bacterium]|nr:TadE/TadG family type IV pilus assembly protein [Actinomycetota bacterium]
MKSVSHRSTAQATVELVLLLPVLLVIALAICQVALALNSYLIVTASSREGARRGAETNNPQEARRAALRAAEPLAGNEPSIEVDFPEGRSKGSPIRVTVSCKPAFLIPGIDKFLPQPTFKGSTLMALERGN